MKHSIIEQLARFGGTLRFEDLPSSVVEECKRTILDSIGCALAGIGEPKGKAGIDYGRLTGTGSTDATIIGTGDRVSIFGAAFANGELINALDMDTVSQPAGHVSPYVLPGALAVAEMVGASGKDLVKVVALAHEISCRFGMSMDNLRDTKDGKVSPPKVTGYSSTVFGATAAIGVLKGYSEDRLAHALGIAGCITPVQSQAAWFQHAPSSTIKYLLAGALTQAAMTAAHMSELGHRGDLQILDDEEYGFPRFVGSKRWETTPLKSELGEKWYFPAGHGYKPYPHCRILHSLLDCLIDIVEREDLQPNEIDGIKVFVEGFVEQPVWLNRNIEHVHDAQFSIPHGIAIGAHRIAPGKAWQDPEIVFSPSVMGLMDKVSHEVHPNYVEALTSNAASRPARIEVSARGQVFVGENDYPKGSPSPDPTSFMTTEELVNKFRKNAEEVLSGEDLEEVINLILNLENVNDVRDVMRKLSKAA